MDLPPAVPPTLGELLRLAEEEAAEEHTYMDYFDGNLSAGCDRLKALPRISPLLLCNHMCEGCYEEWITNELTRMS